MALVHMSAHAAVVASQLHSRRISLTPGASDLSSSPAFPVHVTLRAKPAMPSLRRLDSLVPRFAQVPDAMPFFGEDGDLDSDRSTLERAFQNDAGLSYARCGPVECSSRGCRPVTSARANDAVSSRSSSSRPLEPQCNACVGQASGCTCASMRQLAHAATLAAEATSQVVVADRLQTKGLSSFPVEFAEFAGDVWCDDDMADKYYRTAVLRRPFDVDVLIKYAEFSWRRMKDQGQAEDLFGKALEEEPENSAALASYALFLWETEAS